MSHYIEGVDVQLARRDPRWKDPVVRGKGQSEAVQHNPPIPYRVRRAVSRFGQLCSWWKVHRAPRECDGGNC